MGITIKITAQMLDAASELLRQLLTFAQPADAVISRYFREHRDLGPRERAFIAETVYSVLRRRRLLERICGPQPKARQLVLAALAKLGGVSQRQFGELLDKDETAWFVVMKGQKEPELSLAEQTDLPDWLCERLLRDHSAEAIVTLARGLNQPAPLDLRVNPMKTTRDSVLARLTAEGIAAAPCRLAPLGIRLKEKPVLARHPLYLGGEIEVQDEGSQLLAHLLDPKRSEMVVDFCAGAGGKTLLLGALMRSTGRLYAFDVADRRLARLKPRVARSGLSNVHPACISGENDARVKRLAGKIDRVLVDAPCSGLGTLRRNPDLKWRQTPESVAELSRKQRDILAGAARLVKLGGRLVYATCSILSDENEEVIDAFLVAHPGFRRLSAAQILGAQNIPLADLGGTGDMRLLPHVDDTDGFYAAVLERTA
jgi:16S rRNA (cytosine967-C5)-methyltransferase